MNLSSRYRKCVRRLWLAVVFTAAATLSGCGGGGSSTAPGNPVTPTTPDMGTAVNVDNATLHTNQLQIKNAASGLVLGISGQSQAMGTNVVQETNTNSTDSMWHLVPNVYADNRMNIENMLTHQVIGLSGTESSDGLPSSSALNAGAQAGEFSDSGTDDEDWVFYLLKDGNYLIQNHYSDLYLQADGSATTVAAIIDQGARATSGSGCTCQEWTLTETTTAAYPMPLTVSGTGIYVHDPYMLQDPASHLYWLYGAHQTIAYSTDLSTFTYTNQSTPNSACTAVQGAYWLTDDNRCPIIGPDFASWTGLQTPPSDNNGENVDTWAPSLLYANGIYYQYYAVPYEPSTGAEAVIGLAASTTPYGPWTDRGYVVTSWTAASTSPPAVNPWGFVATTTWNAIDPAPFIDASGNWWLQWGSWQDGMHTVQLDPTTGLRLASNSAIYNIAFRYWGEEGSFIYYGNGYYYYFGSINPCCSATSTYRIVYGRATSPTGPFLDRGGQSLSDNGGTILLSTHSNIVGPGGESIFTDTGANGSASIPTIVYHYYDGNNNGTPTLGINRLSFTSDGWPYIQ
jgi:arabinan endo-1,5-alpha-L-arabinosidase